MVHPNSSRSYKICNRNSTSTIPIQCIQQWHSWTLRSGPPHPPHQLQQLHQQNKVDPVHVHKNTSRSGPPAHCAHVHKSTIQVCKPGESLALRKVKHLHNGRTLVNRLPLTKQDILSHYSGCFEGTGHFAGDPYKFHLKPEHKPA